MSLLSRSVTYSCACALTGLFNLVLMNLLSATNRVKLQFHIRELTLLNENGNDPRPEALYDRRHISRSHLGKRHHGVDIGAGILKKPGH